MAAITHSFHFQSYSYGNTKIYYILSLSLLSFTKSLGEGRIGLQCFCNIIKSTIISKLKFKEIVKFPVKNCVYLLFLPFLQFSLQHTAIRSVHIAVLRQLMSLSSMTTSLPKSIWVLSPYLNLTFSSSWPLYPWHPEILTTGHHHGSPWTAEIEGPLAALDMRDRGSTLYLTFFLTYFD